MLRVAIHGDIGPPPPRMPAKPPSQATSLETEAFVDDSPIATLEASAGAKEVQDEVVAQVQYSEEDDNDLVVILEDGHAEPIADLDKEDAGPLGPISLRPRLDVVSHLLCCHCPYLFT